MGEGLGKKRGIWIYNILPSFLLLVLLVGIWQLIVTITEIKSFLLPSPSLVVAALVDMQWQWGRQILTTLIEILGGFLLADFVGILVGVLIMWSPLTHRSVVPFLVLLNSMPKIALAPLFIIWLGYGVIPNIFIAFITAFFPVAINTATGIGETEADMIHLARVWEVPRWKIFFKIQIPNALPYIFSGIKIAATMAVIGAIVGEFVASTEGLAAVIMNAQAVLVTEAIFASLIWISALGLGLYGLVALVQRLVMPWADIGQ
jgi:NitT/TauT family transport system permease protein